MAHKTVYLCLLSPLTFLCVSSFRLLCRSGCSALDFLFIALLSGCGCTGGCGCGALDFLFIALLSGCGCGCGCTGGCGCTDGCTDTDPNRHYHDPYPFVLDILSYT